MIRGRLERGRPTVDALVRITGTGRYGEVAFLIDTGSDTSVLHPRDALDLGIDFDRDFLSARTRDASGIGGAAREYIEAATLSFRREDGDREEIGAALAIAVPTDWNLPLPSLLGRDILLHFRLTFHESAGLVLLQRTDEL